MSQDKADVLLIGYGNPGRLDDGLGPEFAAALEKMALPGVTVDSDYQLTVEDAAAVAEHEFVIFVDAAVNGREPFSFAKVIPKPALGFSSHSMQPDTLVALAEELFGVSPKAYTLGIRGYEFNEFSENISVAAQENLASALQFMAGLLKTKRFAEAAREMEKSN